MLLVKIDDDLYINPQHIESVTIETSILLRTISGKIYAIPNTDEFRTRLMHCEILPEVRVKEVP